MGAKLNLKAGDVFGRLTLVNRTDPTTFAVVGGRRYGLARWVAICVCGQIKEANQTDIVLGKTRSCGCLSREITAARNHKHGGAKRGAKLALYRAWTNMRNRCSNKNSRDWARYGGRGISVCESWSCSFTEFAEWAEANGYDEGLEIDRVDNEGNYEPSNCRFVAHRINSRNTSACILDQDKADAMRQEYCEGVGAKMLAEKYGVNISTVRHVLKNRHWV